MVAEAFALVAFTTLFVEPVKMDVSTVLLAASAASPTCRGWRAMGGAGEQRGRRRGSSHVAYCQVPGAASSSPVSSAASTSPLVWSGWVRHAFTLPQERLCGRVTPAHAAPHSRVVGCARQAVLRLPVPSCIVHTQRHQRRRTHLACDGCLVFLADLGPLLVVVACASSAACGRNQAHTAPRKALTSKPAPCKAVSHKMWPTVYRTEVHRNTVQQQTAVHCNQRVQAPTVGAGRRFPSTTTAVHHQ